MENCQQCGSSKIFYTTKKRDKYFCDQCEKKYDRRDLKQKQIELEDFKEQIKAIESKLNNFIANHEYNKFTQYSEAENKIIFKNQYVKLVKLCKNTEEKLATVCMNMESKLQNIQKMQDDFNKLISYEKRSWDAIHLDITNNNKILYQKYDKVTELIKELNTDITRNKELMISSMQLKKDVDFLMSEYNKSVHK